MTSKEFVLWLKGFTEGAHEFNVTPKQWDILKEKLAEVNDNVIPMGGILSDHNTFKTHPYYIGDTPVSNPFGTVSTTAYRPPYTTGGEDEIIKTHNED